MHRKEDTLPLLPLHAINEPSIQSAESEENAPSADEFEAWDDEVEPLEAVEDDEALALWDGEVGSVETQDDHLSSWEAEIDPFEHRHLPTSVEAVPIEEADIRHAFSQADTHMIVNTPVPPVS